MIVYIWSGTHEAVSEYRHCCLWKWSHQKTHQVLRRCGSYPRTYTQGPEVRLTSGSWHYGIQLTLHATRPTPQGASRLVQAMSAWSVNVRRAPSRHRRDAEVYSHTTTAIHDAGTPHRLYRWGQLERTSGRRGQMGLSYCCDHGQSSLDPCSTPFRWNNNFIHAIYVLSLIHI